MNLAADLSGIAETLTEVWPKIEGKTLIQPAEIARARTLGEQLVRLFAVREKSSASAEVTETRQRAFTLVVRAYEEIRRAMTFLRWYEQDADTLAPSLYAGRGNGHTKTGGGDPSSDTTTATAPGASSNVTEPAAPVVPGGPGGDSLTH